MKYRLISALVAGALNFAAPAFSAPVPTFYVVQDDTRFTQTGPSTVTASGFSFVGSATPNDGVGPIAFDGGSITFPASSPLSPAALAHSGPNLQYRSGLVADQATFQTNYPIGTYAFHLTDSTNASHTEDESVNNSIASFPATTPMLTSSSYSALQAVDPTQAITVHFNSFADSSAPSLIFFALVDSGNHVLLEDGLQPNVTQDTIAANTMQPGTQYGIVLFFTNIEITPDNMAEVIKDNQTQATFTTLPEPAIGAISLLLLSAAVARRRRGRARAAEELYS